VKTRIAPALCTTLLLSAFFVAGCAGAPSQDAASPAPDTTAPESTAVTTPPAAPPAMADSCNADAAKGVVGQKASEDIVEQARVASGAKTTRVIRPNQAVTMDYRGDRLNVNLAADDVIASVTCG
jgi:hypothetical protein